MIRKILWVVVCLLPLTLSSYASSNMSIEGDVKKERVILAEDTIVGNFSVAYKLTEKLDDCVLKEYKFENGEREVYKYPNEEVCLIVKYKDETIFSKRIGKSYFVPVIPAEELPKNILCSFHIKEADVASITFATNICIPDTDICYYIGFKINSTGRTSVFLLDDVWESDHKIFLGRD